MATLVSQQTAVLSSWKDIARYTGKGVRTVQRWERELGLPVRRPAGRAHKSAVITYRSDIDAWMAARFFLRRPNQQEVLPLDSRSTSCGSLRQSIETAGELNSANNDLVEQIRRAAHMLAEHYDLLTTLNLEVSWCITASKPSGRLKTSTAAGKKNWQGSGTLRPTLS